SSCSSTDNNGGTGNNNNQGGGNGGNTDTQQQTITPKLKADVTTQGALSKIYDTTAKEDTNTLIAKDIKANPETYFENGADLKSIEGWTVTVDGNFDSAASWEGQTYDEWSKTANIKKGVYEQTSAQLNIASLKDLKSQLSTSEQIKKLCEDSNLTFSDATEYKVQNQLGFTDGDLLHVNVTAKQNTTNLVMDVAIPVSDLNLKITGLKVSVSKTENQTGNNVAEVKDLTTNFTYNIGINDTVKEITPTAVLAQDKTDANKVLKALGYATEAANVYTLDNDKLSDALGLYNCKFEAVSSKATNEANKYTVTLKATPNDGYVWENGTKDAKEVSFVATLNDK
ncbi:hypothetical protein D8X55_03810, partial [Malacoplasma penetrans]